jgi:hypothetical protein
VSPLLLLLLQLPKALQLPLQSDSQQLHLTALAAAVPSRLLVTLLAAAASPGAVAAAQQVLGWLDAKAAAKNDYLGLFKSRERFPEVCGGRKWACKPRHGMYLSLVPAVVAVCVLFVGGLIV